MRSITRNLALVVLMVALSTLNPQQVSALENGSGASSLLSQCRDCKNKCADDYPNGGGPRQTCLNLCASGACKTTTMRPSGSPVQSNPTRKQ